MPDVKGAANSPLREIWSMFLSVMFGCVTGLLVCSVFSFAVARFNPVSGMTDASVTAPSVQSAPQVRKGLEEFLASNPFHISPQKQDTPAPPPPPPVKEEDPMPDMTGVTLRGTLPGTGAWLERDGRQTLTLINGRLDKWSLVSVDAYTAVFTRDGKRAKLILSYGPVAGKKEAPRPAPAPSAPAPSAPAPSQGSITAAGEGNEGTIPAEMVASLVQNPFDELKRIRMRPNEKEGGLEVQWIQNDSILRRLGVRRGDVIRSVNGIPFTNMGDIANSINSLMNSERFDVEVTRGGKSTPLRYVVK